MIRKYDRTHVNIASYINRYIASYINRYILRRKTEHGRNNDK